MGELEDFTFKAYDDEALEPPTPAADGRSDHGPYGKKEINMLASRIRSTGTTTGVLTLTMAFLMGSESTAVMAQSSGSREAEQDVTESDPKAAADREKQLLSRARQLTFEGRRAGEGYFSKDGTQLVFQSEREPGNPFFQIYVMDLETGDVERVSPGRGKTTCAWIHPTGDRVLLASTQDDKDAIRKQ